MKLTARILSIILAAACIFAFAAAGLDYKNIDSVRSDWENILDELNGEFDELERKLDELAENGDEYSMGIETYIAGMKGVEEGEKFLDMGLDAIQYGGLMINKGYEGIEEGREQLVVGREAYEQGLAQYNEAKAQFENGKAMFSAIEPLYNAVMGIYSRVQAKQAEADAAHAAAAEAREAGDELKATALEMRAAALDDEVRRAEALLNAELNGYSISGLIAEYEKGAAEMAAGEEALKFAEEQLAQTKEFLDSGDEQLDLAKDQLDMGMAAIGAAKLQYNNGKAQFDQGIKALGEQKERLNEIEKQQIEVLDEIENALDTESWYDKDGSPLTESVRDRLGNDFEYMEYRVSEETGDEFMVLDLDAAFDVIDAGRDFADDTLEALEEELESRECGIRLTFIAAGIGMLAALLGIIGVNIPAAIGGFAAAAAGAAAALWMFGFESGGQPYSAYVEQGGTGYMTACVTAIAAAALLMAAAAVVAKKLAPARVKKEKPAKQEKVYNSAVPSARVTVPRYNPDRTGAVPAAAEPVTEIKTASVITGSRPSIPRYKAPETPAAVTENK